MHTLSLHDALPIYLEAAIVLFESSNRLIPLLKEINNILGNRKISLLKEITKAYEKTEYGYIENILEKIKSKNLKGEFVLIIEKAEKEIYNYTEKDIKRFLKDRISEIGISKASKEIAKKTMKKSDYIYKIALDIKKDK